MRRFNVWAAAPLRQAVPVLVVNASSRSPCSTARPPLLNCRLSGSLFASRACLSTKIRPEGNVLHESSSRRMAKRTAAVHPSHSADYPGDSSTGTVAEAGKDSQCVSEALPRRSPRRSAFPTTMAIQLENPPVMHTVHGDGASANASVSSRAPKQKQVSRNCDAHRSKGGKRRRQPSHSVSASRIPRANSVVMISSLAIDNKVEARVKEYLQSQASSVSAELPMERFEPIKGTTLGTVSITFTVPAASDGAESVRVTAQGISPRRKTATRLCYMHASRLIDFYTVDLPQWAQKQKQREKESGVAAAAVPRPEPPRPLQEEVFSPPSSNLGRRSHVEVNAVSRDAKHAAFYSLKLPKTGIDIVDRASAMVEARVGAVASADGRGYRSGAKRHGARTAEENAMQSLNSIMRDASPVMQPVRLAAQVWVCTLPLDESAGLVAMGVGVKSKVAKARCAMHALAIIELMKTNPQATAATVPVVKATTSECGESKTLVCGPTAASAPLSAILSSLAPRYARLYEFFCCLFEHHKPATSFSRGKAGGGLYICELTLDDVTSTGSGLNRFEAERSALEAALSQMELYDDRLQAINALLTQYPTLSPQSMPTAALPVALRGRVVKEVTEVRTKLGLPEVDSATETTATGATAQAATENIGAGASAEEAALLLQLQDRRRRYRIDENGEAAAAAARRMQEELTELREDLTYRAQFHPRRSTLAMATIQDQVVRTVASNRVTIICGTTGCGKTTQVPQYILDSEIEAGRGPACNILVTQPRRLTAFGVADRIAHERLSHVGEDVGYIVRLDAKPGRHITICTAGVLVQMLSANPNLDGVTHLILDEVHERDINCDVLLSLAKQFLETNKGIRLVLMSATMQAGLFETYFDGAPTLAVEGAVFPVNVRYLDDIAMDAASTAGGVSALPPSATATTSAPLAKDDAVQLNFPAFYSPMFDLVDQHNNRGGAMMGGRRNSGSVLTPPKTDYQLIAYLVYRSVLVDMQGDARGKSILVFLPGWKELLAAKQAIESFLFPSGSSLPGLQFHFVLLHSSIDAAKQRECFQPAPEGRVKVVLATNIAESGITIDDGAVVVDTGLIKLSSWVTHGRSVNINPAYCYLDEGNGSSHESNGGGGKADTTASLTSPWAAAPTSAFSTQLSLGYASRANATQRKGRAGRTQSGVCYRLFTRATWDALPPYQRAEIHRVPLTQVLLRLLSLGHHAPRTTLHAFIEPPSDHNVDVSMAQLKSLDAVTVEEQLTPLGRYLARLPCDPRVGKMIALGAVLRCLDSVLTVAATTDVCPFITSREVTAEVRKKRFLFSRGSQSDHLSYLNAFNGFCQNSEDGSFARCNHLNMGSLRTISRYKRQYRDILTNSRLITREELRTRASAATYQGAEMCVDSSILSSDAQDVSLVKACVCAALFPNIAVLDATADTPLLSLSSGTDAAGTGGSHHHRHLASKLAKRIKLRTKFIASISPSSESACRRVGGPRDHGVPTRKELMLELAEEAAFAAAKTQRQEARLTPSSSPANPYPAMYYVYQDVFTLHEARKSFLTSVTSVSLWALLLFSVSSANMQYFPAIGLCVMDGWLPVRIDANSFQALHALKTTLHACVWMKYSEPSNAVNNTALGVLRTLCKEVLKAPLDMQDLALNRLVDSGAIVSPIPPFRLANSGTSVFDNGSTDSDADGAHDNDDDDDLDGFF